jgi:hypothetical protein
MSTTLVIVPCGRRKIWDNDPHLGPTPASDAYVGPLFKVNKKYAQHFADAWVVLSAKYGLVSPTFLIPGPYDVSFKQKSSNPVTIATLEHQISAAGLDRFRMVIGLGGKEYRFVIAEAFGTASQNVCFPFAGARSQGEMMSATNRAIATGIICP